MNETKRNGFYKVKSASQTLITVRKNNIITKQTYTVIDGNSMNFNIKDSVYDL